MLRPSGFPDRKSPPLTLRQTSAPARVGRGWRREFSLTRAVALRSMREDARWRGTTVASNGLEVQRRVQPVD